MRQIARSILGGLAASVLVGSLATPAAAQNGQTPGAAPQAIPHPCDTDANYHAFDFWIGVWDVQATGKPRAASGATSRIERQLGGCVIEENWEPLNGPYGKSFNVYNRATKQWEQFYTDATGNVTHYTGTFHADGNLYYEADQFGTANRIRMTFFNEGANQVRQLGHISRDGGKTWTVTFDLTYVRRVSLEP